jgi:hypothetical protein
MSDEAKSTITIMNMQSVNLLRKKPLEHVTPLTVNKKIKRSLVADDLPGWFLVRMGYQDDEDYDIVWEEATRACQISWVKPSKGQGCGIAFKVDDKNWVMHYCDMDSHNSYGGESLVYRPFHRNRYCCKIIRKSNPL